MADVCRSTASFHTCTRTTLCCARVLKSNLHAQPIPRDNPASPHQITSMCANFIMLNYTQTHGAGVDASTNTHARIYIIRVVYLRTQ